LLQVFLLCRFLGIFEERGGGGFARPRHS
jgi:hypothetical protein